MTEAEFVNSTYVIPKIYLGGIDKNFVLNSNTKLVQKISAGLAKRGGYCPCRPAKLPEYLCPCEHFCTTGECICGLYVEQPDEKS